MVFLPNRSAEQPRREQAKIEPANQGVSPKEPDHDA